jgi:RsmE family RNA methyltransferase
MNIVLFSDNDIQPEGDFFIPIRDERAKHIIKILHKDVSDTLEAGIIDGMGGTATIKEINSQGIYLSFMENNEGKPLHPLAMIIGFPRPIQLKRLFRDMAGLGISEIHLTGTQLGEKSYMDSNLIERGTAFASLLDGTVQAKSTHVPKLFTYTSVSNCLSSIFSTNSLSTPIRLNLDNIRPQSSLGHYLEDHKNQLPKTREKSTFVYAAIGSERGWTDMERQLFDEYGFATCSMGERVLRTETAATVAASIILDKMEIL